MTLHEDRAERPAPHAGAMEPPSLRELPREADYRRLGSLRKQLGEQEILGYARDRLIDLFDDPVLRAEMHSLLRKGRAPLDAVDEAFHYAPGRLLALFRERVGPDATILDFGCGAGSLCNFGKGYEDLPNRFVAVDIRAPEQPFPSNARFVQCDLHEFEWDGPPFGAALSLHVFEHVPEPERLARKLRSLLAPGALVYLAVPDGRNAMDLLQHVWARDECDHVNAFTPEGFVELLGVAGFALEGRVAWPAYFSICYPGILGGGRSLGEVLDRLARDLDQVHLDTRFSIYGHAYVVRAV